MTAVDLLTAMDGVLPEGRRASDETLDPGRLTLTDVQWATNAGTLTSTFIVTMRQLDAASESRILWTDQNVQRGVRPEITPPPPALLPLADGYPDPTKYVFDSANADEMVEKLLAGQRVYLNPLVWNLRPGTFEIFVDHSQRRLHLYAGRVFLPDSHHRHQALVRAFKTWREAPDDYPAFDPESQLSVELYFMSASEEAEYFYEKNQLGKRADRSRAYELSGQDVYALTAKRFAEITPSLRQNVNRVTDRLTARNPQIVTLSTLQSVSKRFFGTDEPADAVAINEAASRMSQFYELLAEVRPELGLLTAAERAKVRSTSMVDQAVVMHAYADVMRMYAQDHQEIGGRATARWRTRLKRIAPNARHRQGRWSGDFFSRENPMWQAAGILQPTKSGGLAVSNTRQTRDVAASLLAEKLSASEPAPEERSRSTKQRG